jgi:DNA-binding XRE family transcriptional regulator
MMIPEQIAEQFREFERETAVSLAKIQIPRRRHLRPGERVAVPELGLGKEVYLSGGAVEVMEYPNGVISAIFPRLLQFMKAVGLALATSDIDLNGPLFSFFRHQLEMSQEALGEALGRNRVSISRYETGKEPIPREVSLALKMLVIRSLLLGGEGTDSKRLPIRKFLDADLLAKKGSEKEGDMFLELGAA